jgi:hypothetical protein
MRLSILAASSSNDGAVHEYGSVSFDGQAKLALIGVAAMIRGEGVGKIYFELTGLPTVSEDASACQAAPGWLFCSVHHSLCHPCMFCIVYHAILHVMTCSCSFDTPPHSN